MSDTLPLKQTSVLALPVTWLGRRMVAFKNDVGGFAHFVKEIAYWTFRPPFRLQLLFQQMEFIGNQSLTILLVSGTAVGAVFGLQIGAVFQVFRAENLMGGAT